MKYRVAAMALAGLLISGYVVSRAVNAQNQQAVPDAPMPQSGQALPGAQGPITPGKAPLPPVSGSSTSDNPTVPPTAQPPAAPQQAPAAPSTSAPSSQDTVQTAAPEEGTAALSHFVVNVNEVEVPVIVKDGKGNAVAGLTYRDFQVYENNTRVALNVFSVDPAPLSIAFVIDQSLTSNVMEKVNHSMGAIQGALTPYDEAAVFTYSNGAKEWTGFTGAQGNRLPAVLALAQSAGSDPQVPVNSGPFAGCAITENGGCVDPNIQPGKSTGTGGDNSFITIPKEIHTLNDAILRAAKELSTRPKERRRVIYVISDGKEYGSKASEKEVLKYLETNKIAVYATLVGDSARWGEGWVDRMHLPFTMYDNILYKYTVATGGDVDSEGGINGMEKSYAKIADEARNQYTLGYLSHESIYNEKFRQIDVRVDRPNLVLTAKAGYYPSAQDYK